MATELITALVDLISTAADQAAEAEDQDELRLWEPWLDAKAQANGQTITVTFRGESYLLKPESPSV